MKCPDKKWLQIQEECIIVQDKEKRISRTMCKKTKYICRVQSELSASKGLTSRGLRTGWGIGNKGGHWETWRKYCLDNCADGYQTLGVGVWMQIEAKMLWNYRLIPTWVFYKIFCSPVGELIWIIEEIYQILE